MQRSLFFISTLVFIVFNCTTLAQAQGVQKLMKSEEEVRLEMIKISRELGVTCTTCHNVKNFKSDTLEAYKTSKEHMRITQMLKDQGFNGKTGPEATCYMCHRGKIKPDYKESGLNSKF